MADWGPRDQAAGGGNTGFDGEQGAQGSQGQPGFHGFQGLDGDFDTLGAQGFQGFQGSIGAQGFQGVDGLFTNLGAQGNPGLQGAAGLQGFQGFLGLQGTQGAGAPGNQGSQGRQGLQGLQGLIGAGPQGFQGFRGRQGFQGLQGIQGAQSSLGAQGANPPTGFLTGVDNGTTVTFDLSLGTHWQVTLTGDRKGVFTNWYTGQIFFIVLTQDGTGGRRMRWPGDPFNTVPGNPTVQFSVAGSGLSVNPGAVDVYVFVVEHQTSPVIFGFMCGLGFTIF